MAIPMHLPRGCLVGAGKAGSKKSACLLLLFGARCLCVAFGDGVASAFDVARGVGVVSGIDIGGVAGVDGR